MIDRGFSEESKRVQRRSGVNSSGIYSGFGKDSERIQREFSKDLKDPGKIQKGFRRIQSGFRKDAEKILRGFGEASARFHRVS